MPYLIACLWITTVVCTIAVATWLGIPNVHAFAPMKSRNGNTLALGTFLVIGGVIGFVTGLGSDRYMESIWGMSPVSWAMLVVLVYLWVCIGYNATRAR